MQMKFNQPTTTKEEPFPGIHIIRTVPNYDDLELDSLRNLLMGSEALHDYDPSGGEQGQIIFFCAVMKFRIVEGTRFVTPQCVVTAEQPTREFLLVAKQEQVSWLKRLRSVLHGSALVKRALGFKRAHREAKHPIVRQLAGSGVMVIEGKHVAPSRWPSIDSLPSVFSLVGKVYGNLVVTKELPRGLYECRCSCGNQTVVRRKHLLGERTQSCGCLRDKKAASDQQRKDTRAWLHSMVLKRQPKKRADARPRTSRGKQVGLSPAEATKLVSDTDSRVNRELMQAQPSEVVGPGESPV